MSAFVIAECGINHQGDIWRALDMIQVAKDCGADAVKFQSYDVDKLGYADEELNALLRQCRLDLANHMTLKRSADRLGIEFMSTGFDAAWIDTLVDLGVKRLKISSGKVKDLAFVRHVASKGLPVIMSNGMATDAEFSAAIGEAWQVGCRDITTLYCISEYPAPLSRVDLRKLSCMIKHASMPKVGFSDHTAHWQTGILAAAAGAKVIEAHLTLDRSLPGPDHAASLLPAEFAEMVRGVRLCAG